MNQSMIVEESVKFQADDVTLVGTLSLPESKGPVPFVLMLAGSGPTDRDDNAGKMKIDLFPALASALAEAGFGSFRYDKRGVGNSEGDFLTTGFYDLEADARQALGYLATRDDLDAQRIFVLGHSEGAMLAARLAAGDSKLAGAILLAGSAKTGEQTIVWQTAKIVQSLRGLNKLIIGLFRIDVAKSQKKTLERLKQTTEAVTRIQGRKVNAKWMREFLTYDPVSDLKQVSVPVLAITGSKDVQVDPEDLELMAELISAPVTTKVLPDLSHLFREDPTDAGIASYKKQTKQPVAESLIGAVTDWLVGMR